MCKFMPLLIAFLALISVNLLTGCAGMFQTACSKALPVLLIGQSYGTDATNAVAQAEAYAAQIPLNAEIKAQLADAIDEARRGIEVGENAIAAAANACSAKDPVEAFQELIAAWTKIESLLGSNAVSSSLKVSRRPLYVPAIVRATRIK